MGLRPEDQLAQAGDLLLEEVDEERLGTSGRDRLLREAGATVLEGLEKGVDEAVEHALRRRTFEAHHAQEAVHRGLIIAGPGSMA